MSYGVETAYTSRGTPIDYEIHKSPTRVAGVVAHWGEKIPDSDLKDRIQEVFPEVELQEDTGFDMIYHQADGTTREEGVADELEVTKLVGLKTIEAAGWKPKEIDALYFASGVPIEDVERYRNYGRVAAEILGLRSDIPIEIYYLACASGGRGLIAALSNPEMQGKKVLVEAVEGISMLTENFNPAYADALSMRFFSNGAAGIGVVPGENMTHLTSAHMVVPDTRGTLGAMMTYEHLLDKDGDTWQEKDNIHMIKVPSPDKRERITMQGPRTGHFFMINGVELAVGLAKKHEEQFPGLKADYGVSHHPSKTVFEHLGKKLQDKGVEVENDWVVPDGNSSAATTLIAEARQLDKAREGSVQLVLTYGAGGSFDGAFILNGGRFVTSEGI